MLNYFIVGLVVGFLLELAMSVTTGDRVNWGERIIIITLWPIMGTLFIVKPYKRILPMNLCEVCLTLISLAGSILFCQFMYEIWDDKYQRKRRDRFLK